MTILFADSTFGLNRALYKFFAFEDRGRLLRLVFFWDFTVIVKELIIFRNTFFLFDWDYVFRLAVVVVDRIVLFL